MQAPGGDDPVRVQELTVRNFRNLASLDVELPGDGAVIIGANGHGKTNFLEAIYYLVLFRSLRGAKDRELVRFGEAGFFLAGRAMQRVAVGYEVHGRRKKVTVDHGEVKKLSDGVGLITAVAFAPADQALVAGGPAGRRRYLDILLSLSVSGYLGALTTMRQSLKQRNAALRQGREDAARAFDHPFATSAAVVAAARRRWVMRWAAQYQETCAALGELGDATLDYAPDHHRADDAAQRIREALDAARPRDVRRGVTTVGPHRDDVTLMLNGRALRLYGSAGQQRTAAVALRLLEAETLRQARGAAPIALYDDVFAELDTGRQERLLALIRETLPGQAIITAPRDDEIPAALLDRPRWRIAEGRLAQ
ncbi:MAG: DNA replication and repair protein RecF [Gemmatimonadota bacterium]|nr:DNA replication and repair protein RecF [Gemmatimonadota bacterium]